MSNDFLVDFQEYGLEVENTLTVSQDTVKALGDKVVNAFKNYDFCYLKNHGVDEEFLQDYMDVSRAFFEKPTEFKAKYPLRYDYRFGYLTLGTEKSNEDRSVGDLHEAFNYSATYDETWPPLDKFESTTKKLFTAGTRFAYRFCDALSLGLGLQIDFKRNAHKLIGQKGNGSILRTIYYPPVKYECPNAHDQERLGEHVDWGTVTINFQDSVGGLEVKNPQGNFLPTDPIPGTVLVTVGLLLQRWTSDLLTGSVNRILIPKEENCRKAVRQAAIFFLNTDDDYTIKCLHGSEKYAPMLTSDFLSYKAAKATKLNQ